MNAFYFGQEILSSNEIYTLPDGIGDGRYLVDITELFTKPSSVLIKSKTCREISLGIGPTIFHELKN